MKSRPNPYQSAIDCFEKHIEDLQRRRGGFIHAVNILLATAELPPHEIRPAVSKQATDLDCDLIRESEEARNTLPKRET